MLWKYWRPWLNNNTIFFTSLVKNSHPLMGKIVFLSQKNYFRNIAQVTSNLPINQLLLRNRNQIVHSFYILNFTYSSRISVYHITIYIHKFSVLAESNIIALKYLPLLTKMLFSLKPFGVFVVFLDIYHIYVYSYIYDQFFIVTTFCHLESIAFF